MLGATRELLGTLALRVDERSITSAGRARRDGREGVRQRRRLLLRQQGGKVWIAPRLIFFLARRRTARLKDGARRLLFERPLARWSQFWEFRRQEQMTLAETIFAVGFLAKATLYPLVALLVSIAILLGAVRIF